ncbi:MAG: glycosyltransferase, partial [Mariniblastus sp.]|nr:glycosyltransferase [Mariniblastus sp.]
MGKFRSEASGLRAVLDLVVFYSDSEGIPYALFESMAAGVPTVAPSVGCLLEVLSKQVSVLVFEIAPLSHRQ